MENPNPAQPGAEQPAETGDDPYAQYHVVAQGETLSHIAKQYYGDARLYPQIFEANRDLLKTPDRIRVGQKLRIP